MLYAKIRGKTPLIGDIKIAGSNDGAAAIIFATILYSDAVLLENIPETTFTKRCFDILESLGTKVDHISHGRYLVNTGSMSSFEIPYNEGKTLDIIFFAAGPLLFRFGKAIVPKPISFSKKRITYFKELWESLGIEVFEDDRFLVLKTSELRTANPKILEKDTLQTITAILSTVFINGTCLIFNPSTRFDVYDLLNFLNQSTTKIIFDENHNLQVNGSAIFKAQLFAIHPSTTETVFFATAAIMTKGNITIKDLEREPFLSYLSVLSKIGCDFEFSKNDLKVWSSSDMQLKPQELSTTPAPGFLNSWHGFILIILTQAHGDSSIIINNPEITFEYLSELKKLQVMTNVINTSVDPDININQVKIDVAGPTKLQASNITVPDIYTGGYLLAAALGSEGYSNLYGLDKIEYKYDNVFTKLETLGADVEFIQDDN